MITPTERTLRYQAFVRRRREEAHAGIYRLAPKGLWLYISENCNLKCIGCYTGPGQFKRTYMTFDEAKRILASESEYSYIDLTSGEGLLHPNVGEIIDICRSMHPSAQIELVTNGSIPPRGRIRAAIEKLDGLGLSIDGCSEQMFEYIRKGSNFERFKENVKEFVAIREETGRPARMEFCFTAMTQNLPELPGVVKIAAELGVPSVFYQPMEMSEPEIGARLASFDLIHMDREAIYRITDEALALGKSLGVNVGGREFLTRGGRPESELVDPDHNSGSQGHEEAVRTCQALWTDHFRYVRDEGSFFLHPCCMMPVGDGKTMSKRYGLIFDEMESVDRVFNSDAYWRLRQAQADGEILPFCGECKHASSHAWIEQEETHQRPARNSIDVCETWPPYDERQQAYIMSLCDLKSFSGHAKWAIEEFDQPSALSQTKEGCISTAPGTSFPPIPYMVRADNVVVLAGSRYLLRKDAVLSEEAFFFRADPDWSLRIRRLFSFDKDKLLIKLGKRKIGRIEIGVHVLHEYSDNYFHVVTEVLPRILLAASLCEAHIPLLIEDDLHPNCRLMVDLVAAGQSIIEIERYSLQHVRNIIFVSDVSSVQDIYVNRYAKASELSLHIPLIRRAVGLIKASIVPEHGALQHRKLYLRRGVRLRTLLNEAEIERFLETQGFEVIDTGSMSLSEQVILFREAIIVVSPTGAALTNVVWCQQGAAVIVLAADHAAMDLTIWEQLSLVSDCQVHAIRSTGASGAGLHDDFSISVDAVSAQLSRLDLERQHTNAKWI